MDEFLEELFLEQQERNTMAVMIDNVHNKEDEDESILNSGREGIQGSNNISET